MKDDDRSLHFLLSGGRLSGVRREHVLERVVRQSSAGRGRPWALRFVVGVVPLAVATGIALTVGFHSRTAEQAGRVPKGAAATAILQARCADQPPGRCRRGDRILFEVDGAGGAGFLAAYAEDRAGRRIWYFPRADGHLGVIPARAGHVVMDEVVRIGAEHAPGRYAVHLFLLDRHVVDRESLAARREHPRAAATVSLEVVP